MGDIMIATTSFPSESPEPGWFIYYKASNSTKSHIYEIKAINDETSTYSLVDIKTGEYLLLTGSDLFLQEDEDTIICPTLDMIYRILDEKNPSTHLTKEHELPHGFEEKAERIINVVTSIKQMLEEVEHQAALVGENVRKTETLERLVKFLEYPIGISTYYKYRAIFEKWNGHKKSIAADMRRSSYRRSNLSPAAIHMADIFILKYMRTDRPKKPMTVYRLMEDLHKIRQGWWLDPTRINGYPEDLIAELFNRAIPTASILDNKEKSAKLIQIPMPSHTWFYAHLDYYEKHGKSGTEVAKSRMGEDAYEAEFLTFDRFVSRATLPLQYVFVDHWLIDVFAVDDETRSQAFRLWFTAFIDAFSRSVAGFTLMEEYPCIETVASGLFHVIWPKESHLAFDSITDPYVPYGIPETLFMDNAWAHHSESVRRIAYGISQHGRYNSIKLEFRPPYRARYGGLIERLFGNFSAKMKETLAGAIKSSNYKDVANAKKAARLIYTDINEYLHELVIRYQHTPHKELNNQTPHQKWLEGIKLKRPHIPARTTAMKRLFLRYPAGEHGERVIGKEGISAFGMTYWSSALSGLPRKKGRKSIKYRYAFDINELNWIALFNEDGDWLCDIKCVDLRREDGSSKSLSLAEKKLAMDIARKNGDVRNWLNYIDHIEKYEDLNERRGQEQRRNRRGKSKKDEKEQQPISQGDSDSKAKGVDQYLDETPPEQGYTGYTDLLAGFMGDEKPRN
jgi:hypothetical protein